MSPLLLNIWNSRFFRFLFVGGTATVLQMVLLAAFVELELMEPVVASAVSYVLSAFYNYTANFYITFGAAKTKRHIETAPKFILVSAFGVTVNTLVFAIANYVLDFYMLAQVVAIVVTFLTNYVLHKFWIYRS